MVTVFVGWFGDTSKREEENEKREFQRRTISLKEKKWSGEVTVCSF